MVEFKFVLKGLLLAVLVTIFLQLKVGGETLETKSDRLLHHSAVGQFLNQTAVGAGRLIYEGSQSIRHLWSNAIGSKEKSPKKPGINISQNRGREDADVD